MEVIYNNGNIINNKTLLDLKTQLLILTQWFTCSSLTPGRLSGYFATQIQAKRGGGGGAR